MSSIVIIGAGIIGCSTAYYLSEHQFVDSRSVHLIEYSPELFASASGKAGGFLAADWYSSAVGPLGALSFRLHRQLAGEHDGRNKWGYSLSSGTSYMDATKSSKGERGEDWLTQGRSRAEMAGEHEFNDGGGPAWLTRRKGDNIDVIGEDDTCAQVDPLRLSQFLLDSCRSKGVHLHQPAKALSLSKDDNGRLTGLRIHKSDGSEAEIACTRLLIAAGAWSPRVFQALFPSSKFRLPVSQLAGHSLVLRSPRWSAEHEAKGCHAVFATTEAGFSPELFSRIGGELYVAGLNDSSLPLPEKATDAKIDSKSIEQLKEVCQRMLGTGEDKSDLEVLREGLCFRPVTANGEPILSRIGDEKLGGMKTAEDGGVYVAAGHGPWGISLSLGTGKVMAEMMCGQKTSANVKRLALR